MRVQNQSTDNIPLEPAKEILQALRTDIGNEGGAGDGTVSMETLLIPLLQKVQEAYNYLPVSVLRWLSKETGIPTSRMHGVITFYSQFSTEPRGRHTIKCCQGTACHVKGSERIADRIKQELNIREGETTDDKRFTYESVACLGTCFLAPVMMVDGDYYGNLKPDKIPQILEKYE